LTLARGDNPGIAERAGHQRAERRVEPEPIEITTAATAPGDEADEADEAA